MFSKRNVVDRWINKQRLNREAVTHLSSLINHQMLQGHSSYITHDIYLDQVWNKLHLWCRGRGSSVNIVTKLQNGRPRFDFRQRYRVQTGFVAHPESHPKVMWVNLSGREVDHSPRLVLRLGMCGTIPPFPQHTFMAWYLFKHKDNCTFIFISLTTTVTFRYIPALFTFLPVKTFYCKHNTTLDFCPFLNSTSIYQKRKTDPTVSCRWELCFVMTNGQILQPESSIFYHFWNNIFLLINNHDISLFHFTNKKCSDVDI
jgi:hypothetical protein